jgi:hypothetical protein
MARDDIKFLDLLPEVFQLDDAGRDFLEHFLRPFERLFAHLLLQIEGDETTPGLGGVFDLSATPPSSLRSWESVEQREQFTFACLSFLAGWVGLRLRPAPARSTAWNRRFFLRALPWLPFRGTVAGIDGLLRAWLADDIVDTPSNVEPRFVVVTDLTPQVNGASSVFQLGEVSTLGVDTVLGSGPPWFIVVDLVTRSEVALLRHPVGVDALRLAALTILEDERPAHVQGELRIRGHAMQLAPGGPSGDWADEADAFARLGEPRGEQPFGTALLWGDPWTVRFPDPALGRTTW